MEKDTLYARFLSNELSEAEIQELKNSGEWEILQSIKAETDNWELPEPKSDQYKIIQEKIASLKRQETKVVAINRWSWIYKAASVIVVVSAVYWFFFQNDVFEYQNLSGTTNTITLPDSTEIILTGATTLEYNKESFLRKRKVKIRGQAYFRVRRKGKFTASYEQGEVQVLGTEFEILTGGSLTRVKCFEGRVKVLPQGNPEAILNPGEGVKTVSGEQSSTRFEFENNPQELYQDESSFHETSLDEVIEILKIQFDVDFDSKNIDINRKYSGKFVHDDLDKALQMVFEPMGIQYQVERKGRKKIILR